MNEIIYGINAIQILLKNSPWRLKKVFFVKKFQNKRIFKIIEHIKKLGIFSENKSKKWLNSTANSLEHQGILAIIDSVKEYHENYINLIITKKINVFFLILDCITDIRNLGACIRTANAAGVDAIIIPKNKSAKVNSVVRRISLGATEYTPIIKVTNISRLLKKLQDKKISIIGTSENAKTSIYNNKFNKSVALIVGNEHYGIRKLTKSLCNKIVKIPTLGKISSLNVSVAAGICMFEILRTRFKKL